MAAPPSEAGAVKVTEACVLPAVAVPIVGAAGTVGPRAGRVTLTVNMPFVFDPGLALPSSKK
jgi:hypothetical protein